MSARTPIIVLHMKELIYTIAFIGLSILLIWLFLFMFHPDQNEDTSTETMKYAAGVYTSSVLFENRSIDVQVIVDQNQICSISLVNLDESISTMYPLVEPAFNELSAQVLKQQSTENISYAADNQYTALMLLQAINLALEKAAIPPVAYETN